MELDPFKRPLGGLLIGVKEDLWEIIKEVKTKFSHSMVLKDKDSGLCWEAVNVYGHVKTRMKQEFLD